MAREKERDEAYKLTKEYPYTISGVLLEVKAQRDALLTALDSLAYTAGWAIAWIRNNDEIHDALGQDITKAKQLIAKVKGEK